MLRQSKIIYSCLPGKALNYETLSKIYILKWNYLAKYNCIDVFNIFSVFSNFNNIYIICFPTLGRFAFSKKDFLISQQGKNNQTKPNPLYLAGYCY